MRRCTGRSLVSGFVDAPGRRDDIVAYADTVHHIRSDEIADLGRQGRNIHLCGEDLSLGS